MHPTQTGLFRQDAVAFVRIFAISDADTDGYSGSKCTDFSLHQFKTDTVLMSALCPKQGANAVSMWLCCGGFHTAFEIPRCCAMCPSACAWQMPRAIAM